jgi:hypothetical protein
MQADASRPGKIALTACGEISDVNDDALHDKRDDGQGIVEMRSHGAVHPVRMSEGKWIFRLRH